MLLNKFMLYRIYLLVTQGSSFQNNPRKSMSVLKDGSSFLLACFEWEIPSYNRIILDWFRYLGHSGEVYILFKANGYTFRGSNSVIFILASHINFGHLIKERICPPSEQILSFKS